MRQFGIRLKILREEKRLSFKELSTITGIPIYNLRNWENGADTSAANIVKLAKFFGITTDYLLGITPT